MKLFPNTRNHTNATRTRILAGSIAALLAVQSAQAAALYWDVNGATANAVVALTGAWDGVATNWNTAPTGTGGTPQAGTTNADDLVFSSGSIYTTGTVTLSGAQVASSITFDDNIAVTLSGGTSLTIGGSGASSGIFVLSSDNAANTISTPIILNSTTAALTFSNAGGGLLTIGTGTLSGSAAGLQTINLTSTSSGGITLSGIVGNGGGGGTVALNVNNTGLGVTSLSGANTYTAGTTLTAGALSLGNATALGTGALTINGGSLDSSVGSLVLANNNTQTWNSNFTFTGTQSLNLGTGAVSLGSTAGSRTVTVNANTLTIGGVISDGTATGLTKAGNGTLTLTGANAYTGTTTVTGGTLTLNRQTGSLITSALTFGGTGTFNMDNVGAGGALAQTLGALTFSVGDGTVQVTRTALQTVGLTFNSMAARTAGATRNFALAGTPGVNGTDSSITLTGQAAGFIDQGSFFGGSSYAVMDGAGTFVRGGVYGTDAGFSAGQTGTAAVLSAAASTHVLYTGAAGTATTATTASNNSTTLVLTSAAGFAVGQKISSTNNSIRADTYITAIAGNTLTLSQQTNNVAIGHNITPYPGITAQTNVTYNTLNLAGPGASVTIAGGNTVTLTNGGILRSAGGSISGVISGGTAITAGAAELVIRTDTASDILNIVTPITGTGGLTKSGAGSLVLNGSNTYTGATTIAGGTVYLFNSGSGTYFGNTAGTVTLAGGSTLNAIGSGGPTVTLTNPLVLSGGNATFIANNGTFFPGATAATNGFAGADFVINGQISGPGGLIATNSGSRRLELKNAAGNTFTGGVTVTGASPSIKVLIYTPTSLGTGPLRVEATGTGWVLESAANLSIGTGVANPVTINSGSTLSVNTLSTNNGAVNPMLLSGVISGGGVLNKIAAGTLILTGVNSYTGGTTVAGGVLTLSGSGNFGSSAGNMTVTGGNLDLAGGNVPAGTVTISGGNIQNGTLTGASYAGTNGGFVSATLAGLGGLVKTGAGRLVLSGANTYSGTTTITAGTLRATDDLSLPNYTSGTINVGASGTLQITTGDWNTVQIFNLLNNPNLLYTAGGVFAIDTAAGDFSNSTTIDIAALGLTKLGANTLTLTGTNSYTGTTNVNRGTLKIDAGAGSLLSSSSPLTLSGTGAFNYDNTTAAGATAQSLSTLTFSAGEGTVQVTRTASAPANTVGLTFSSLAARTAGATRNFVLGGTPGVNGTDSSITLTGQALGFIDQGSFFGGSAYAYMNAAGTYVRGGVYGTDAGFVTSGTTATLAAATHQQITGAITGQNTATFTTLNISGNNNFALAATQTVTVNGILKSGNTAGGATISNGTGIQAASGAEMVVRTDGVNDALTISTPILANGASSLTKSGNGTLTLSAANTITGGVRLNAGTLNINNAQPFGSNVGGATTSDSVSRFTINEGTTIDTTAGALSLNLKYPMTWNGSFTFTGTNDLTFKDTSGNGNITMPNDVTITVAAKTLTIPNNFAATSATLTKEGPGTLFFGTNGGANYSGGLVINNGVFTGNSSQGDGIAGTGPVTLGATSGSNNAILSTGNNITQGSNPITARAGSSGVLALTSYNGTATWGGPVILNNNLTLGGTGGSVTLSSAISGSGGLLIGNAGTYTVGATVRPLTNTGTVTLVGINTFTGDTVMVSNSGTLQLGGLDALKNSTLDTGTSGGQQVTFGVSGNNTYNIGGLKGANDLAFGANTISVGANGQSTAYTGALSGPGGALTKTGSGKLTLSGTNDYTGVTTLSAGTLQFAKFSSLYKGVSGNWTAANIRVASGATLAFNVGGTGEFDNIRVTALLGNLGGANGTSTTGFAAGSKIAFDTTNSSPTTFSMGDIIANSTGAGGGAIGVTKLGANTLELTGASTYTGATTVSAGTLSLTSTASLGNTAITVANGATLSVLAGGGNVISTGTLSLNAGSLFTMSGSDNALGSFTLGGAGTGLTLGGATVPALTFDIGDLATGTDQIIVTNNVSAPSGGTITINQLTGLTGLTVGNYNLITSAGGFTGGGANGFTLSSSTISVASVLYDLSLANSTSTNEILTVTLSPDPEAYWAGSADGNWNTAGGANWRTTVAGNVVTGVTPTPTTNVFFVTTNPVAANLTTTLGANITIKSLNFTADATAPVSISGSTLTINGANGITVAGGSAAHSISSNVTLGASQTWTVDATAGALAVSGAVTGGFALTKAGTGILTLRGANTYTGVTTVTAGMLQVSKQLALYNNTPASWTAANINVKSGGTLDFNVGGTNEFTTGDVATLLTNLAASSSPTNGMNAGSVLGFDTTNASGGNFTIAGAIANTTGPNGGARGLTKFGTNKLTLTGTNTYTGATTISAGTLQLGSGGTTGALSASSVITNNGNLTINRSNAAVQGTHFSTAAITGTGSFTQAGAGTTTLNAANYAGVTTVSAGTLLFAKTAGLYNSTVGSWTAANLNVASGGTLAFNVGGVGEFSTGHVTILLGNLAASASATDGMNAGANLGFDTTGASGGTFTVADVIADTTGGSGGVRGVTKLGSGNLTLTGVNTYTGGTMVNSGTFTLGNQNGGGTGAFTLAAGTTFQQENFEGNSVAGALPNGFVLTGAGNVTMNIPFSEKDIWLSQVVSGTGGFTVQGGSRALTLTANNTFSGGVRVTNANHRIQISDNNALGSGTFRSETNFNSGYLSPLASLTIGNAFDIASGAYLNVNTSGDGGTVTLLLSGLISSAVGTGGLYKYNAGTLTLSGANTYTGTTTIGEGTLSINTIANVGAASSAIGAPITVPNGLITIGRVATTGTLLYTGAVQSTDRTIQIGTNSNTPAITDIGGATIQNDGAAALTFSAANFNTQTNAATGVGANRSLTLRGSSTAANTISGIIQDNLVSGAGTGTATVALIKADAGTWVLAGANTYTGLTDVQAGTLVASNATSLGTTAAGTTVTSGATLDVQANIGTEAISVGGTGGGTGALVASTGTGTVGGAVVLTADTSVGGAGTLNVNGAVTGGFNLNKVGAGTTHFGVAGSLAGVLNLTAEAGTTNVNSVLGTGTSAVSVGPATAATLKFGSVSQTLGSLTIGAGSTVTFTSGLASFSGGGGGGKAPSLGGGGVVPEPGTLGLLLVGALGVLNRRRRQSR